VLAGGAEVYVEGIPAITDDGETVVYASQGGPHAVDLFSTTRDGGGWGAPVLLTAGSGYAYNNMPALGADGRSVLFDCGVEPYPESGGNDACRVGLDGSGFERIIGPDALPDGRNDYVQNPHEGVDAVYFEGSWPIDGDSPETIWRLPVGASAPEPFSARYANAVAPCPLPDGRVAMLWLGGNDDGYHQIVVAEPDGSSEIQLTPGVDVADIGIGCGS
jgi:Tol biopolymer transport system component